MLALSQICGYNRGINQLIIIMFEYTIEVPNTTIKETRSSLDECWDICYDMAQEYGLAEVVFYALNGNRVVQGSYTDQD